MQNQSSGGPGEARLHEPSSLPEHAPGHVRCRQRTGDQDPTAHKPLMRRRRDSGMGLFRQLFLFYKNRIRQRRHGGGERFFGRPLELRDAKGIASHREVAVPTVLFSSWTSPLRGTFLLCFLLSVLCFLPACAGGAKNAMVGSAWPHRGWGTDRPYESTNQIAPSAPVIFPADPGPSHPPTRVGDYQ